MDGVAAPVGGKIFNEVLPYLESEKTNKEEIEILEEVVVPNILGLNFTEASKILKENNLNVVYNGEKILDETDKETLIITQQIPIKGITVNSGNNIYIK